MMRHPANLAIAGVVTALVGLALLGLITSSGTVQPLGNAREATVGDTRLLVYDLPYLPPGHALHGTYRFSGSPGDVFVVDCDGLDQLARGEEPAGPAFARQRTLSGSIRLEGASSADTRPPPPPGPLGSCIGQAVVFRWETGEGPPSVTLRHGRPTVESPSGVAALLIAIAGLLTAGFAIVRSRKRAAASIGREPSAGRADILLEIADKMVGWLRTTRRYLVLAGLFGILVWFPLGLPLGWALGTKATLSPRGGLWGLLVVAATLATLTAWWLVALRTLDRDLADYERRLERLHAEQERILR